MSQSLVNKFGSVSAISTASLEELSVTEGVGEVIAQSVIEWFGIKWHQEIISKWESAGVKMVEATKDSTEPQNLVGLIFVVTGSFEKLKREEIFEIIEARGGKRTNSVSSKTDFLVAGDAAGSKLAKAQELGIRTLNESQFKTLLAGGVEALG